MVQPLTKVKKVKKYGNKKFNRHQHDRKIAVKVDTDASCLCTWNTSNHLHLFSVLARRACLLLGILQSLSITAGDVDKLHYFNKSLVLLFIQSLF